MRCASAAPYCARSKGKTRETCALCWKTSLFYNKWSSDGLQGAASIRKSDRLLGLRKPPQNGAAVARRTPCVDTSGWTRGGICTPISSDLGFRLRPSGFSTVVCLVAHTAEFPVWTPETVKLLAMSALSIALRYPFDREENVWRMPACVSKPSASGYREPTSWHPPNLGVRSRSCAKGSSRGTKSRTASILPRPARAAIADPAGAGATPRVCRCGVCGKPFNVLSGTALARLRHRECWGEYPQALIEGDTVGAAAQPLRCAQEHPLALAPAISRPSRRHQAVQPARQAWKRTKPTSCNPTRGSATCRARLARAGGWPTSAACPASRSR